MKKTISINIAGVVFYIEEDGYNQLRSYLASIQKYFANYESSREIVEDIEGRIAEKLSDKLKKDNKQAIELTDVEGVMAQMGSVSDFEAMAEEEDLVPASKATNTTRNTTEGPNHEQASGAAATANRRLCRDTKRKLLGGVCAGLAHYWNTDPLWIRLVTMILVFGLIPAGGIGGAIVVAYLAFWIAFPGDATIEEDPKLKKLFRDPDQKVLGGVLGGIAKYTGWDLGIVRFVTVLLIFAGGLSVGLYLLLWVITPMAKTLTDKMQMTGEPITLENIETNVKKGLNAENRPEEALTRLLLFPFRALAAIFSALAPLAQFVVSSGRIFGGVMLLVIGILTILGLVIALGVGFGISQIPVHLGSDVPLHFFTGDVPKITFIFGFLLSVTPFVALSLLGIWLIGRKNPVSSSVWQSLLGLFLAGVLGTTILVGKFAQNFNRKVSVEKVETLPIATGTAYFVMGDDYDEDSFRRVRIELEGYEGADIKLVQELQARGKNKEEAKLNATAIKYSFSKKDSTLVFNRTFDFAEGTKFRDQEIRLRLYVPYEKPFAMTDEFARFISNSIDEQYFEEGLFKGSLWKFTRDGELICTNRTVNIEEDDSDNPLGVVEGGMSLDDAESQMSQAFGSGKYSRDEKIRSFDQVEIASGLYVEVRQGEEFKVWVNGDKESLVQDLKIKTEGNTLKVYSEKSIGDHQIGIRITMPKLEGVNFSGRTIGVLKGFQATDRSLKIELSGNSKATLTSVSYEGIKVELAGQSNLSLIGSSNTLKADLTGASNLYAWGLEAGEVKMDVSGQSNAQVKANKQLKTTVTGNSRIAYRGKPADVQNDISGEGVVEKAETEQ